MERGPIREALDAVVAGSLADAGNLAVAPASQAHSGMASGFHCHDGWELFVPLGEQLRFEIAGLPPTAVAAGHVLLVRPGCWHLAIHRMPQRQKLRVLMVSFPQAEARFGGVWLDRLDRVMSEDELAAWTSLAREAPGQLMDRVADAVERGGFARQRALSDLHLLLSSLGEVLFGAEAPNDGADAAARAEAILHREYYRSDLDLAEVARMVGVSTSHLSRLFKRRTGHSVHQTLIAVRLRRARELLQDPALSIKEVAALTGWSNQLYFSSAFRACHGVAPTEARRRDA
jgi:AraC-like DNA-binding protein